MKFEHIIDAIQETRIKVLTNEENTNDYDFVVNRLSHKVVLSGINEKQERVMLDIHDISYIETGEQLKSYAQSSIKGYVQPNENLKNVENRLESIDFMCRINRDTIVNIGAIENAKSKGNMKILLTMKDASIHIVSRAYQKELMERLK